MVQHGKIVFASTTKAVLKIKPGIRSKMISQEMERILKWNLEKFTIKNSKHLHICYT